MGRRQLDRARPPQAVAPQRESAATRCHPYGRKPASQRGAVALGDAPAHPDGGGSCRARRNRGRCLVNVGRHFAGCFVECRRDVQPVLAAMQNLGSHLDVGVVQRDYATEVGDVKSTYDRLTGKHSATPCQPVVRALGEAMDAYTEASSEWNECIFSEEEECAEASVQELWSKADVAIARGKHLLSSLADGPAAVAAAVSDEEKPAANALARQQLRSAQIAMETYAVDHDGSYSGATVAKLKHIEPTLPDNLEVESASGT